MDRLLACQAVIEVPPGSSLHCSPARLLLKTRADGSLKSRLVVNFRGQVNDSVVKRSYRNLGLRQLALMVQEHDTLAIVDIRDAFMTLRYHEASRPFLAFSVDGGRREFQPISLSFGHRLSPWAFQTVLAVPLQKLRDAGLTIIEYVDDIGILVPRHQRHRWFELRQQAIDVLAAHGFSIAVDKLQPGPSFVSQYLGLLVDTTALPTFRVPPATVLQLRQQATSLLASAGVRRVPAYAVKAFCGKALSVALALAPARLRTRALFSDLGPRYGRRPVRLHTESLTDLQWWAQLPDALCHRPARPPPLTTAVSLFSDASFQAWGVVMPRQHLAPELRQPVVTSGLWAPTLQGANINILEATAALHALRSLQQHLVGRHVLLFVDNTAILRALSAGTSKSPALMDVVRQVWAWLEQHDVTLSLRYVRSLDNPADEPSRSAKYLHLEWQVARDTFLQLEEVFNVAHTIDVCASEAAHHCDRFCSRTPQPSATHVDAFSISWADEHVWCCPPMALVLRCLYHFVETAPVGSASSLTLVTVFCPNAVWMPLMRQLRARWVFLPSSAVIPPPQPLSAPGLYPRPQTTVTPEPLRWPRWRLCAFHLRR
jgi:hypothetical protein